MMASSPSDPGGAVAVRKQHNGPPFKFLVPLVYAPILPLIRITLRKNPVVRDRLFTAVLAGAFAHGFYLVYPFPLFLSQPESHSIVLFMIAILHLILLFL